MNSFGDGEFFQKPRPQSMIGGTMIFETHAHYDDEQFDMDQEGTSLSMPEQGG